MHGLWGRLVDRELQSPFFSIGVWSEVCSFSSSSSLRKSIKQFEITRVRFNIHRTVGLFAG